MKAQITYNDKTVDVELTLEQMKGLGLQDSKKTGWGRVEEGAHYYTIISYGAVDFVLDSNNVMDENRIQYGNYFSDKALATLMAKAVGLYLRMRRWADEHNTNDCTRGNFEIEYSYGLGWDIIDCDGLYYPFAIRFSSEEIAKQALEEFKPELEEIFVNGLWHLGGDNND